MINWEKIKSEFESTTCTMKSLAEKYEVSPSTLRSRKNRENWQRNATQNAATQNEVVATEKKGGQFNNQNAKGNKGNKKASAPKGNKNATTHGLFAKWLPEETADIIETLQDRSEADMIWDSIMFQYTAIVRAQKIMFVTDKDDLSNATSGYSSGEGYSESYAIQYAWDKHASFMNAQSRAMSTLSNLIKQFVAIADEADGRRLKLELMQAQIKTINAKLSDDNPTEFEDDGFLAALESEGEELWPEE